MYNISQYATREPSKMAQICFHGKMSHFASLSEERKQEIQQNAILNKKRATQYGLKLAYYL